MTYRRTLLSAVVGALAISLSGGNANSQEGHGANITRSAGQPWDCVVNTTDDPLLVTVTTGTTGTGPYIVLPGNRFFFGFHQGNKKATVVAYRYGTNTRVNCIEFDLINQAAGPAPCFPIYPEGKSMKREDAGNFKSKGEVHAP